MSRFQLARFVSLVCLVGGALQIIYGLLAIPFPPYVVYANTLGWDEALWALINVGMIGAVLGLLALDVACPRWLARIGATLTILGNLIRIGAAIWNFVFPTPPATAPTDPFILLSVFLLIVGLGILGVTTLLGKQLSGWQAWAPLLIGYVVFTHAAKEQQARHNVASGATAHP